MQQPQPTSNDTTSTEPIETIQTEYNDSVLTDRERQETADKLLAEQLQKEEQLQKNEYKQPAATSETDNSGWRVKQGDLLTTLTNINSYNGETEQRDTWATDYGIRITLEHYIGQYAYIVD